MRLSSAEKQEIIELVDRSEDGVNQTLKGLGIHKSTFYKWYRAWLQKGPDGLNPKRVTSRQWNSIPESQKQLVIEIALENPALSSRELSLKITDEQKIFISESSVYRILKARGLITTPAHSKMLGHRSIKTTQIYAKVTDKKISDDTKILFEVFSEKQLRREVDLSENSHFF